MQETLGSIRVSATGEDASGNVPETIGLIRVFVCVLGQLAVPIKNTRFYKGIFIGTSAGCGRFCKGF